MKCSLSSARSRASRSLESRAISLHRRDRQLCLSGRVIFFKGFRPLPQQPISPFMKIGVPKEIKTNENRIALVPAGAESLISNGHSVLIETGGGLGSGFSDKDYTDVGAKIAPDAATVWK